MEQTNNTLIDLSDLGLLRVSGEGAARFLQGQLTCHLDEITPLQSRLGAHCTPQGRIISLFRIFFSQNHYYLQMPTDILQKYAVFFKVELADASRTMQSLSFYGPNTTAELAKHLGTLPEQIDEVKETNGLLLIKLPGIFPHYEIIGEPGALAVLREKLSPTLLAGFDNWKQINIAASIPAIYAQTTGKFLPHELNLPLLNGVSFNKGCYTGQEIIARMQYRGQLKNHLYRARVQASTLPQPGDDIYNHQGKPCGSIVDACQAGELLLVANQHEVEWFLDPDKNNAIER
jgi:folate-binding protein YgfZ